MSLTESHREFRQTPRHAIPQGSAQKPTPWLLRVCQQVYLSVAGQGVEGRTVRQLQKKVGERKEA